MSLREQRAVAAILAGGKAERMGGVDKATLLLAGRPLWSWVGGVLAEQSHACVLCLGMRTRTSKTLLTPYPVVTDGAADRGPIAGVAAALAWANKSHPSASHIVTSPVDTPFLPGDLVSRLMAAAGEGLAIAESAGRRHHAVAAWPLAAANEVSELFQAGACSLRAAQERLARRWPVTAVDWVVTSHDPFFNINTSDDLREAEQVATKVLAR